MNKKKVFAAAMNGNDVEYVPSAFSLHFRDEEHHGKAAVNAHLDFYRQTDVDFLKIMNENKFASNVSIKTADDWKHVRPIDGTEDYVQDQLDIVKALSDAVGDEVFLYTTIHGIFASAFHATGDPEARLAKGDTVSAHLREKPEVVGRALRNIAEGLAVFARLCLEAGSDGIYYAALGAENYRYSPDTFNEYIRPNDVLILDAVRGAPAGRILHMCKDHLNIELYKDYPCEIVNWASHEHNVDLATGKSIFQKTVLGGFDDRAGVLVDGTPEQIDQTVKELIDTCGTRGYILGADCTLPTDIDYDRVRRVVETSRSLGDAK